MDLIRQERVGRPNKWLLIFSPREADTTCRALVEQMHRLRIHTGDHMPQQDVKDLLAHAAIGESVAIIDTEVDGRPQYATMVWGALYEYHHNTELAIESWRGCPTPPYVIEDRREFGAQAGPMAAHMQRLVGPLDTQAERLLMELETIDVSDHTLPEIE